MKNVIPACIVCHSSLSGIVLSIPNKSEGLRTSRNDKGGQARMTEEGIFR
jgi:hypothetical protein